jgi:hypothetical protein
VGKRKRQDLAALVIAMLVLAGAGVARLVTYGGGAKVPTRVLGQTFTRDAPTTTAAPATGAPVAAPPTTSAPPAPGPQATTTTTAAQKAPKATTTTTSAPAPTTTTTLADCGAGETRAKTQASVAASVYPGHYIVSGSADIINNLSRTIAVDKLAVRLTYGDGTWDVVEVPSAAGAEVRTGETKTVNFDDQTTTKIPTATSIEGLDYRVAGLTHCPAKHLKTT